MIWVAGKVVDDEALRISALDRTFEHGLGLFETFRTWDRRPALFDRHLARLTRSARELNLPLDPTVLPSADDVSALLGAEGRNQDAVLRLTLSGGTSADSSVVWMRASALPSPSCEGGARAVMADFELDPNDPLVRHKTLNYWSRRLAYEAALGKGADEALLAVRGVVVEGSRTSLFAIVGHRLRTPSLDAPILPGVMRGLVLERAAALGLVVEEGDWRDLGDWLAPGEADEVFLTNSVRGLVPVGQVLGTADRFTTPGPWTRKLSDDVENYVRGGG